LEAICLKKLFVNHDFGFSLIYTISLRLSSRIQTVTGKNPHAMRETWRPIWIKPRNAWIWVQMNSLMNITPGVINIYMYCFAPGYAHIGGMQRAMLLRWRHTRWTGYFEKSGQNWYLSNKFAARVL